MKTKAKAKGGATGKRSAAKLAKAKATKAKPAKAKAKAAKAKAAKAKATKAKPVKRVAKASKRPAAKHGGSSQWLSFVEKHGVVLASARGPVPTLAEAVAGEPIVGSWWAHPKGNEIFAALSEIDDSTDVRSFKLVDGKVTLVHRKAWPALVRLGQDGLLAPEQLAAIEQEHMPTGEHRNLITPFPEWVDEPTRAAANQMTTEEARAQLAWVEGT